MVAESSVAEFAAGDEVIVTGYDLGMNTAGGFGQYIRVPAAWVIKRPQGLSLREAMILGTAGLTAALCVEKLERSGLRPDHGSVLVTGASGGSAVSPWNCWPSSATPWRPPPASWSRPSSSTAWGPSRSSIAPPWPMASTSRCSRNSGPARWTPSAATSSSTWSSRLQYGGSVACCGLTAGAGFKASVLPFILRGVNLLGVDSVELPLVVKASMWDKLSLQWKLDNLEEVAREIALEELPGRSTRSSPASWSAGCWSTSAEGVAGAQLRQQVARP